MRRSQIKAIRQMIDDALRITSTDRHLRVALQEMQKAFGYIPEPPPVNVVGAGIRSLQHGNQPSISKDGLLAGLTWVDPDTRWFHFRLESLYMQLDGVVRMKHMTSGIKALGGKRVFHNIAGSGISVWCVPPSVLTNPLTPDLSIEEIADD